MRIIVFSDSHSNFGKLDFIVKRHRDADAFLHLGDGVREYERLCELYPDKRLLFVRGNCDWGASYKEEDMLVCGRRRIFYTHGHRYGVKAGLDKLASVARGLGAEVALFGHTHRAYQSYQEGVHLFNPGSVAVPRGGDASYGLMDITAAGIAIHHVWL